MHILIAIVTIISAIGIWYWRLKMLSGAARDAADVAKTVANMPRRLRFAAMTRRSAADVTEDPIEAAFAILCAIALARDDEISSGETRVLLEAGRVRFRLAPADAEAVIARGEWLARQVPRPAGLVRRMTDVLIASVPREAQADLAELLEDVVLSEGEPSDEQVRLIGIYLKATGLGVA